MSPSTGRTPAHFRTMREALGISVPDLAEHLGVDARSVRRWGYTDDAPEAAWAVLDAQAQWLTTSLDKVMDSLERAEDEGDLTGVDLSVYANDEQADRAGLDMPAAWHRAGVGVIAMIIEAEGVPVRVSYVPRDTV